MKLKDRLQLLVVLMIVIVSLVVIEATASLYAPTMACDGPTLKMFLGSHLVRRGSVTLQTNNASSNLLRLDRLKSSVVRAIV